MNGAPLWIYPLLVGLVILGVRRLRTREMPIAVALIPIVAFSAWSLWGAGLFAQRVGPAMAALVWSGGAALGVASAFVLPEPRATRLPGGRVLLPGSWMPLSIYLLIFVARFACGAWAAIVPSAAMMATGIGVAISAGAAARFAAAVLRWRADVVGVAAVADPSVQRP